MTLTQNRFEAGTILSVILFSLLLIVGSGVWSPVQALETEPPLPILHDVNPSTTATVPLATFGLYLYRRAADGWFNRYAVYQSESFSILTTALEPRFLLNFRWIRLSLVLPLLSRTLNQDAGTTSNSNTPTSDVTTTGLGDARIGLYVNALTGPWQVMPYFLWKPPTGDDDLMVPNLAAGEKGGTFPLGTGSHELDFGVIVRHRFGTHLDLSGWTALRWRQKHDPLWIQQSSAVAWNGISPPRDPLLLAGWLGRFWFTPDYPALELTATWRHPLTATRTNLLEGRIAVVLRHHKSLVRLQIESPLYGRFFPDPFPSMLLDRQPSLGISAGGEFVVSF